MKIMASKRPQLEDPQNILRTGHACLGGGRSWTWCYSQGAWVPTQALLGFCWMNKNSSASVLWASFLIGQVRI